MSNNKKIRSWINNINIIWYLLIAFLCALMITSAIDILRFYSLYGIWDFTNFLLTLDNVVGLTVLMIVFLFIVKEFKDHLSMLDTNLKICQASLRKCENSRVDEEHNYKIKLKDAELKYELQIKNLESEKQLLEVMLHDNLPH